MRNNVRRNNEVKILVLVLVVLMAFAGGCGGSGDDDPLEGGKPRMYVLGEMHGDLSDAIAELVDFVPFTDAETDGPLMISHISDFSISEETAHAARVLLEDGHAIGVEHATEGEVNMLLEALGIGSRFVIPSGYTYVGFYGVKLLDDGDILTYVTLNDDEYDPEEIDDLPEDVMIGEDRIVSSDVLYDLSVVFSQADIEELMTYGLIVSGDDILSGDRVLTSADVIQGDLVLSPDGTWVLFEDDEVVYPPEDPGGWIDLNPDMARNVVEWLFAAEEQAKEVRLAKEAALHDISKMNGSDLTKISTMFQMKFDASDRLRLMSSSGWGVLSFIVTVDVYACHTYNQADGSDSDWFMIKQRGSLNPSEVYYNYMPGGGSTGSVSGYIVNYTFDNYPVDADGKHVNAVELRTPSPETTVGSSGISSSVSFNFGGNVGFSGLGAAGGVSLGASYSSSESQTVPDCQVTNNSFASASSVTQNRAQWVYSFSRPVPDGRCAFGGTNMRDAPLASRNLFQPLNQWAWKVSSAQRDQVKGFKFSFKWTSGYSRGESFVFGIKRRGVEHRDDYSAQTEFHVPFGAIYPPLIAANALDFSRVAGYKKLTMATCRSWSATSDSAWCQLSRISGEMKDVDDVYVTVDENKTGQNREAYITLKTTDNKGTFKVKVFQAKN